MKEHGTRFFPTQLKTWISLQVAHPSFDSGNGSRSSISGASTEHSAVTTSVVSGVVSSVTSLWKAWPWTK